MFTIRHALLENKYFSINDNKLILTSNINNNSLFMLEKNTNGSYSIKMGSNEKYLKYIDNCLITTVREDANDSQFQFYFEKNANSLFMETNFEYTDDGRFIKQRIDNDLNVTKYKVDTITGLTKSITNPKGKNTYYNYNDKNQLVSIINDNRKIEYHYDDRNILNKICQGKKIFNFIYDAFFNTKAIKIGEDITLITNNYESKNGNLLETVYGNNQTIKFDYDEFSRVIKMITMNDTYNYKYGNNGDLIKIISNNHLEKYDYDLGKRLNKYTFDNFEVIYSYDDNNNITNVKYGIDANYIDDYEIIDKIYDKSDKNIGISFDNKKINYMYDDLGRLTTISIDNSILTDIDYITKGQRTSDLISSFTNGDGKYLYKYDNIGNITHIYFNGLLKNKFYYDDYDELIREDNYFENVTIRYRYDDSGNLLYKTGYKLNTYDCIYQNKYKYDNCEWEDQLTSYNGELITYDNIGNPISIGNNINLSWINGRQLCEYSDSNNNISFSYSNDGKRLSKIVNGVETRYYLEGSDIVLEKCNNNVLYYIRNSIGGLIAFKYNDNLYYYLKNAHDDITGILDSNYNVVARYQYDSWGNIVSIVDDLGNDVAEDTLHIANINPFRYRSYYYDKETKLYYLNTRYYNPRWGRFINADGVISTSSVSGFNLYQYTFSNPINHIDANGRWPSIVAQFCKTVEKNFNTAINKAVSKQTKSTSSTKKKTNSSSKKCSINNKQFAPVSSLTKELMSAYELLKSYETLRKAQEAVKNMSKQKHYSRNQNNAVGTLNHISELDDSWKKYAEARCHSFNGVIGNTKWVKEVGRDESGNVLSQERVFDGFGNVVWDPNNMGTYNYSDNSDRKHKTEHFNQDVAPWIIWGNSECDTTTVLDRIRAYHNF